MATRFYFPGGASAPPAPVAPPINPAEWTGTINVDRKRMTFTRLGVGGGTVAVAGSGVSGTFSLVRQYVSDPIAAQLIDGTIKGQIRASEVASANNYFPTMQLYVCSNDGAAVRGVLYSINNGLTEFPTSLTNRALTSDGATPGVPADLQPVDAEAGDRIVIELGYLQTSTATAAGTIDFRDNAETDLPEDETETAALNPWVEFSADIAPAVAGGGGDGWSGRRRTAPGRMTMATPGQTRAPSPNRPPVREGTPVPQQVIPVANPVKIINEMAAAEARRKLPPPSPGLATLLRQLPTPEFFVKKRR